MQKSTVVILAEGGPIGDAAPQALRGLRGGWRSPRRRLRAHGPGRAGVVLHPELQNRVRLLPVAQPQTYRQNLLENLGCEALKSPCSLRKLAHNAMQLKTTEEL